MSKEKATGHGWLKAALADKGHTQHDVAIAWGCDDAVVSRFINTGTPELTYERMVVLSRMLGIDMNELDLRLREGVEPRKRTRFPNEVSHPQGGRQQVLAELKVAVERARQLLPGERIEVKITRVEEEL